jgi:hypothetical protein
LYGSFPLAKLGRKKEPNQPPTLVVTQVVWAGFRSFFLKLWLKNSAQNSPLSISISLEEEEEEEEENTTSAFVLKYSHHFFSCYPTPFFYYYFPSVQMVYRARGEEETVRDDTKEYIKKRLATHIFDSV